MLVINVNDEHSKGNPPLRLSPTAYGTKCHRKAIGEVSRNIFSRWPCLPGTAGLAALAWLNPNRTPDPERKVGIQPFEVLCRRPVGDPLNPVVIACMRRYAPFIKLSNTS